MILRQLKLYNFKNYEEQELLFSAKVNCFVGGNGAGKTNLLDAIHYLSFCKSYFNPVDSQNIRHRMDFFAVHGVFEKNEKSNDSVSIVQKRGQRKQCNLNKKEHERLADHIGLFPVVMISPYDRDLINEGSEVRRRLIDGIISQFDRLYLDDLISYNKALKQRNALLKKFAETRSFSRESISVWDQQLMEYGLRIFEKRQSFINEFVPVFRHYFEFISHGQEQVELNYQSQLFEDSFKRLLESSLEKDRMLRFTNAGIHKDDLTFLTSGYPVKKFGSQGQQKSFVIALRLAQFEYIKKIKKFKPILLLDDIFDKLDESRVKQLLKLVGKNNFGQTFITDTQHDRVEKIFEKISISHRIFRIENNNAELMENTDEKVE